MERALKGGEYTDIGFQAKLEGEDKPPKAILKFNDVIVFNEMDPNFSYDPGTPPPPEENEEDGEEGEGEEDSVDGVGNDGEEDDKDKEDEEKEDDEPTGMVPGLRKELQDNIVESEEELEEVLTEEIPPLMELKRPAEKSGQPSFPTLRSKNSNTTTKKFSKSRSFSTKLSALENSRKRTEFLGEKTAASGTDSGRE